MQISKLTPQHPVRNKLRSTVKLNVFIMTLYFLSRRNKRKEKKNKLWKLRQGNSIFSWPVLCYSFQVSSSSIFQISEKEIIIWSPLLLHFFSLFCFIVVSFLHFCLHLPTTVKAWRILFLINNKRRRKKQKKNLLVHRQLLIINYIFYVLFKHLRVFWVCRGSEKIWDYLNMREEKRKELQFCRHVHIMQETGIDYKDLSFICSVSSWRRR